MHLPIRCLVILISVAFSLPADIVDFGGGAFNTANGQHSAPFTLPGTTLTLTALPDLPPARLRVTSEGVGIDTVWIPDFLEPPDEINLLELLKIEFSNPVILNSFTVMQLFRCEGLGNREYGEYRVNGGAWIPFKGNNNVGTLTVSTGGALANKLEFDVPYYGLGSVPDDYSVKALNYTAVSVPEPSGWLFFCLFGMVAGSLFNLVKAPGR